MAVGARAVPIRCVSGRSRRTRVNRDSTDHAVNMLGERSGSNFHPLIAARLTDVLFEVALLDSGAINFDPFRHDQIPKVENWPIVRPTLAMFYRR